MFYWEYVQAYEYLPRDTRETQKSDFKEQFPRK